MATLPSAWHYYRVSAGTGWPGVSILWLSEMECLVCNFYLSVATRKLSRQICPWDTLACCWDAKQASNQQQLHHEENWHAEHTCALHCQVCLYLVALLSIHKQLLMSSLLLLLVLLLLSLSLWWLFILLYSVKGWSTARCCVSPGERKASGTISSEQHSNVLPY